MKLLLLGAPGAGKGTMAQKISARYGIPQISTGDMLRQEIQSNSSLGQKVKAVIDSGELVNDELMLEIVTHRLAADDCEQGMILDGYPRNLQQAKALSGAGVALDAVLIFDVSDEVVIRRLSGRRVHPASGRTYHIDNQPPATPDIDDETGEPLVQREDDMPETVRRRLEIYHEQTKPLVEFYHAIAIHLDAERSIDEVEAQVFKSLDAKR